MIKEFQVKQMPDDFWVENLIDDYNSKNPKSKHLPKKQMILFYALLKENTWEGILRKESFSRASVYNYKRRFKLIGITDRYVSQTIDYVACENLNQYHVLVMYGYLPVRGHTYK